MIREATIKDAVRIAEIDVISSRYAYKDIISDECLNNDLSFERRLPAVERWFNEKLFDIYVYEDSASGMIKGMMGFGRCEDEDKKDAFELHFIYVDPEFVRFGIGSELIRFFEQIGNDKGFSEYVVWVLEENITGKKFYEKHGYHSDGKNKIFNRWNKREIRYVK